MQQRRGRKTTTLIEGLDQEFNFKKILKYVGADCVIMFRARVVLTNALCFLTVGTCARTSSATGPSSKTRTTTKSSCFKVTRVRTPSRSWTRSRFAGRNRLFAKACSKDGSPTLKKIVSAAACGFSSNLLCLFIFSVVLRVVNENNNASNSKILRYD